MISIREIMIVVDVLEKYYGAPTDYQDNRMEKVCTITNATKAAYRSWFSRSRKRVRVPLDGMCKLAFAADADIMEFLGGVTTLFHLLS